MSGSHPLRTFTTHLATCAAVCSFTARAPAEPSPQRGAEAAVYHADPEHLWNRVHESLFVRVAPDGRPFGRDRFEPLLWLRSQHLLVGPSHDRAVNVLDEFVEKRGDELIEDPLKRALLQRDLWLVFSWLEGNHPEVPEEKLRAARPRLRRPLATATRRLALAPEAIRKLPDNYAAAVASGRFARSYDPEEPDRPYLPPDLYSADGPWVCVGRSEGPVARLHLDESNRFANSALLVFLRVPGGREAALRYLKETPGDLPVGGEVALVRRALLIASTGDLLPSNLTESVQVRVGRETGQHVEEFRLHRIPLFAGREGGLLPTGETERDFKTGFASHAYDPFEEALLGPPLDARRVEIKEGCRACHSPDRFPGLGARSSGPLSKVAVMDAMGTAVRWRRERADWKALVVAQ